MRHTVFSLQRIAVELKRLYNCCPVYLDKDLKEKYYKGGWGWWMGRSRMANMPCTCGCESFLLRCTC